WTVVQTDLADDLCEAMQGLLGVVPPFERKSREQFHRGLLLVLSPGVCPRMSPATSGGPLGLAGRCVMRIPGAVDDVGTEQVPDRCAEGMYQAGERKQREQGQPHERVQFVQSVRRSQDRKST